jgi:hypothetical protein
MLFHDAVLMAVDGVGKTLVAVGPPNRYEEIAGHANATLWACPPASRRLDWRRVRLTAGSSPAGMNDFQAAAKGPEAKVVSLLRAVRTPRSNGAGHPAAQLPLRPSRAARTPPTSLWPVRLVTPRRAGPHPTIAPVVPKHSGSASRFKEERRKS